MSRAANRARRLRRGPDHSLRRPVRPAADRPGPRPGAATAPLGSARPAASLAAWQALAFGVMLAGPAVGDVALPHHLRLAPSQCPPWTAPDQPRQPYLTDARPGQPPFRTRGEHGPYRLDEVATIDHHGTRYRIPVGYVQGMYGGDSAYDAAIGGSGLEVAGIPALSFWIPDGRPVERYSPGQYQQFCEPGRPPPAAHEYAVGVEVLPPVTPWSIEVRAARRHLLANVETYIGAPLRDLVAGRVPAHRDRLLGDVPGGFVLDGFYAAGEPPLAVSSDPLGYQTILVHHDGLSGRIRCEMVVVTARTRPDLAPFTSCEVKVGPSGDDSPRAEMHFWLPRNKLGEWPAVYRMAMGLLEGWEAGRE